MAYQPQPHISAAVKHLRGWVTILAVLVAACCLAQMLIYGFVRFTDIRYTEVKQPTPYGEKLVVLPPGEATGGVAEVNSLVGPQTSAEPAAVGGVRARAIERGREVAPDRVLSRAHSAMKKVSLFAVSAGTLSCVMLAVLTLLGTVIAGGGNIPGVERAVTATTWALVIGLLCLPWSSAFPALRIPGVFADYTALCAAADKVPGAAGGTAAFFQWIFMPLACITLSMMVLGMFRAGVERGVIVTSVSQFDAAIQKEMTDIARRGVVAGGRAVGTLNRAVGAAAPVPTGVVGGVVGVPGIPGMPSVPMQAASPAIDPRLTGLNIEHALEEAAAVASSMVRDAHAGGRSVADTGFRRLI